MRKEEETKMPRLAIATIIFASFAMISTACNSPTTALPHKLVATAGQSTVPMYPDEQSFLKISHNSQQGGVTGMVGDVQKNFSAKQIADQTPVKVLSGNDNGSEVVITDGPMKGQAGFVANQNVD
jgi:hypothetical protein